MSEPVAVRVPQINPNDEHAIVVRWHVDKGTHVHAGQSVVTLETTKTTFDVDAPQDGYLFFEHEPHSEVAVGAPVAWIADTAEPPQLRKEEPPRRADVPAAAPSGRFTRKALKLMKERHLTAADFPGDERIDADAVERAAAARGTHGTHGVAQRPLDAEPLELRPSKLTEIQTLSRVHEQVVPSSVTVAVDCAALDERLRRLSEAHGPVSLLELCIYETAQLLPEWPELNGFYADRKAWRYRSAAIGFAVNAGRGLRVPVIKGAGKLALHEVARAARELSLRYMRDELAIDDVTGGTFTITDLSGEGVVHFMPVLNERQSSILGLTAERSVARTRDLVLAFDHRLSDGMQAGRFLAALRDRLEGAEG
ncbi:MAG TPA: 2-oxo acid dehydrogenase subunit E2 [Gammaproteobacteria bacterium]|nr:2-oxo acid dehydrogenase subunit E2 [Gammaproteobacteria bacterium]